MAAASCGGVPHPRAAVASRAADHGASGGGPDQPGSTARQHHSQLQPARHEGHRQDMEVSRWGQRLIRGRLGVS